MSDISNRADIIDSRDIIERIEEIEAEHGEDPFNPEFEDPTAPYDEDARAEYIALLEVQDTVSGITTDWVHGVTLIRNDYFADYMKEHVQDAGYLPDNMPEWLTNNLDWDGIADDLQVDYSDVDYDGETYWVR